MSQKRPFSRLRAGPLRNGLSAFARLSPNLSHNLCIQSGGPTRVLRPRRHPENHWFPEALNPDIPDEVPNR
jgi:hypothetical protein